MAALFVRLISIMKGNGRLIFDSHFDRELRFLFQEKIKQIVIKLPDLVD